MTSLRAKITAAIEFSHEPLWVSALVGLGWAAALAMLACGVRS